MTHDDYVAHDALGLAALVRSGQVTAEELATMARERIDALNPALNAVVRHMDEGPAGEPEAPFHGVPYLAKDLLSAYRGHPTSAGSRLLAGLPAPHDSELVRRVRASGVKVLGKTNLPEWGLVPYTESELWGVCRNPWDTARTPGGSSGGSAAAVASGMVPMAGGGDGGGSIRIPASCCGLFGLKPTRGRIPTGPDYGDIWRGSVVEHVLTRSVRDSAAMLDATHGPDPGAPSEIAPPARPFADEVDTEPGRLRIAWTVEPILGKAVDRDCVDAVADAVKLLEGLGHDLFEATPELDGPAFAMAFMRMVAGELSADLEDARQVLGRRPRRAELEPTTWALGLLGGALSATEFAGALRTLERAGRRLGHFFEDYDVLLTPTLATSPPPVGSLAPTSGELRALRAVGALGSGRVVRAAGLLEQAAEGAFDFTPWTPLFNTTGQPAMSVPLHWNEAGLPVGAHLVGRFGAEATLLRLAGQLERARPWLNRLPELAHSLGAR